MKDLKFIEGPLPPGFKPDFEPFIFNESAHRRLQAETGWVSMHLVDDAKKRSFASVHFYVKDSLAQSPAKAPFGAITFSKDLSPAALDDFLKIIERTLQKRGVKKIVIRNPPELFDPANAAIVQVLLLNNGFTVTCAEIAATVPVDKNNLEEKIETWELRKIKQGRKAKLNFEEIPMSALADVHAFILACRNERGQTLSMTAAEIGKTVAACPDSFFLFGVYDRKALIAASISIRISKKILYNFYSAHPRKADTLSPVVFLIDGMYSWCQDKGITLLDLGTSALEGKPNFGLLEFKRHLGGMPSAKLTFEKMIG